MKYSTPRSSMRLALAFFGILIFASFFTVTAQTTTFAQFLERTGGQDFIFTNNLSSGNFNAIGGGSPVFFLYSNISGLDPSLQGLQNAHVFVTTTTTTNGSLFLGNVTQPLNQTVTVQIIRDTAAPVGVGSGSRTNLLTAVFSPSAGTPGIVGSNGGNSATLAATTPDHVVTFTSDFLGFALTTSRNLSFSFSSVTPNFALGPGSFLQSITAAATGTFASDPPPIYSLPTAALVSINGQVLTPEGRALRNATVTAAASNGTVHEARTGPFGYFSIPNIESGQSVVLSVRSKQYSFAPRIVRLDDNIAELTLIGQY